LASLYGGEAVRGKNVGDTRYFADIDGLRAVAVTGVVAYHAGITGIPGGFTGVDVFFVISGFLITRLLLGDLESSGRISLPSFYARRIRRLLPSLATVLAVTLVLGFFLLPLLGERQGLAKSALSSLIFVANHYFLTTTGGYFDQPAELQPLLHLWSLSVEEQFYVVWPLILICLAAFVRGSGQMIRAVRLAIGVVAIASFAANVWMVSTNPQIAFYTAPTRAWELGLGAFIATLPLKTVTDQGSRAFTSLRPALAVLASAGLIMVATSYGCIRSGGTFPGYAALLSTIGTSLLIFAHTQCPGLPTARLLALPPFVFIGKLSYAWYLWHWPLFAFARINRLSEANLAQDLALAIVALTLAWLTYVLVEQPIRRGTLAIPNMRMLRAGAISLGALALLAGALGAWGKFGPQKDPARIYAIWNDRNPYEQKCLNSWEKWTGAIDASSCSTGPAEAQGRVFVWGDSLSDSWSPMIRALEHEQSFRTIQLSMTSCAPILGEQPNIRSEKHYQINCMSFNSQAFDVIRQASGEQTGVVLAAHWPGYIEFGSFTNNVVRNDRSSPAQLRDIENLEAGLRGTLAELATLGLRALVVLTPPEFKYNLGSCVSVHDDDACGSDRTANETYRERSTALLHKVARDYPNVRVFDPFDDLCPAARCPAFIAGKPVAFDSFHPTASIASLLKDVVAPDIRWLLLQGKPALEATAH
jgi:peptidoglycan/LPS O-acetylase OafA/YrhL